MFRGRAEQLPSIMAAMRVTALIALAALGAIYASAATECACDPQKPETMEARQCSLCREAERQPANPTIFFLKDINPRKPNRWLALPKRARQRTASLARSAARRPYGPLDRCDRKGEVDVGR